jgi:hypothetical protein
VNAVQNKFLLIITILIIIIAVPSVDAVTISDQRIHVEGTYNPSTVTPTPTSTATPTATPQSTPTADPTITSPTPTMIPSTTSTPTAVPSTTDSTATPPPTASPTPEIPEFPWLTIFLALFILLGSITVALKKFGGGKLKATVNIIVIVGLLAVCFAEISVAQPVATPTQTATSPKFSLWFTNGTAFPSGDSNSAGYINGGMYLNIGGIRHSISNYGSLFVPITNVVVLRNDAEAAVTVNATLKNVNTPSNISIALVFFPMPPATYAPYSNNWLGNGSVANQNPVAPGQYMYLGLQVILSQSSNVPSGTPTFSFIYSFDIEITATQAS